MKNQRAQREPYWGRYKNVWARRRKQINWCKSGFIFIAAEKFLTTKSNISFPSFWKLQDPFLKSGHETECFNASLPAIGNFPLSISTYVYPLFSTENALANSDYQTIN